MGKTVAELHEANIDWSDAMTSIDLAKRLEQNRYPRSSSYDPTWVMENMMGPHPLWLMEHLTSHVDLRSQDRVLDLGCGKALTSVFLAREFGSRVHAVDLWIPAGDNWPRITAAGETDRVVPIYADAHELPFADGYFDVVLSVDAYHYFGTVPDYLPKLLRFLRPGGILGIVCPGLAHEVDSVPEWLVPYWEDGFSTFHTPAWWQRLWEESGLVKVRHAAHLPHGAEDWLQWSETADDWAKATGGTAFLRESEMLRADPDGLLGFVVIVASKT